MKRKQQRLPGSVRESAWCDAARAALTPVVGALLDRGLGYAQIVRVVGEAVVRAALEREELSDTDLVERTGVPRGLAGRLRSDADRSLQPALPYAVAIRLVSRWLSTAEFSQAGKPRRLPLQGPASFATLCAMSGVNPATALPALRKAGVVRVTQSRVELRKDAYVPSAGEIEMLDILGRDGAEFLRTMIHNTEVPPARAMFQRKASYDNIGGAAMPALRAALREEAMRALLAADSTLAASDLDRNPTAPRGRRTRVSFGVYVAEEPVMTRRRPMSGSTGRRRR